MSCMLLYSGYTAGLYLRDRTARALEVETGADLREVPSAESRDEIRRALLVCAEFDCQAAKPLDGPWEWGRGHPAGCPAPAVESVQPATEGSHPGLVGSP